jgi:hypothetical protein
MFGGSRFGLTVILNHPLLQLWGIKRLMPEPHPSLSFRHTNERSLRDLGRRKSMVTSRSLGGRAAFRGHDGARRRSSLVQEGHQDPRLMLW